MNTTKILAKRMIDSLHDNFILEKFGISDEDLELLELVIKSYLNCNNQVDWGFDSKLNEYFIEVSKDYAIMNYNIIEIFGLDDNGYEHLIESIEDLKDFDRFMIEK